MDGDIATQKLRSAHSRRVLSIEADRSTHHPGVSLDYDWYSVVHASAAPRSSPVLVPCGDLACAYLSLPEPIAGVIALADLVEKRTGSAGTLLSPNLAPGARKQVTQTVGIMRRSA